MKRAFLVSLGLEADAIEDIMKEHGKSISSVRDELETIKEEKTALVSEVDALKETNKTLEEASDNAETLQKELNSIKNSKIIDDRLAKENFKDLEYAKFKLGELEVDAEKGEIIDIESKLKALKESSPNVYNELPTDDKGTEGSGDKKPEFGAGYTTLTADLVNGQGSKEPSLAEKIQERLEGK